MLSAPRSRDYTLSRSPTSLKEREYITEAGGSPATTLCRHTLTSLSNVGLKACRTLRLHRRNIPSAALYTKPLSDLPRALLAQWPVSFTCHCGGRYGHRIRVSTQSYSGEKKFFRHFWWDWNWQPFHDESGARPTSYPAQCSRRLCCEGIQEAIRRQKAVSFTYTGWELPYSQKARRTVSTGLAIATYTECSLSVCVYWRNSSRSGNGGSVLWGNGKKSGEENVVCGISCVYTWGMVGIRSQKVYFPTSQTADMVVWP